MKELGLYVHIPFCKKKCAYCDFISYENKEELISKYIKALMNEIKSVGAGPVSALKSVTTIYIGGRNTIIYRFKIYYTNHKYNKRKL